MDDPNGSRFARQRDGGLYESFFQRANHPERPLAFWIRYTAFRSLARPEDAVGEIWAVWFDGEARRIAAVKQAVPVADCRFSPSTLDVRIGGATLDGRTLRGRAASADHVLDWSMRYAGHEPPLLLLPEALYGRGLPRAKALVGTPNAVYTGTLSVDGHEIPIDGWRGSQNHNWGSQHTDSYAWGQVAGFDDAPDAFLECSTAQLKIGPLWTPRLTLVVLRDRGEELALNGLMQAVRAHGRFEFFTWSIDTRTPEARIRGRIHAAPDRFVGLTYPNPPGGTKTCLNAKLASAEFTVERPGRPPRTLATAHRAAFEILTDRSDHGVPVAV